MRARRFCLVTTFYPPFNFGGDGIFVRRLATALARRGHEVHVIHDRDAYELLTGGEPAEEPEVDPAPVTRHTLRRDRAPAVDLLAAHQAGRPLALRKRLEGLFETLAPDVIHFHNISMIGGPGVLALGSAIKLCTMHDYWFVCPMHTLWRFDREACLRRTCLRCTLRGRRPPQLWRRGRWIARMAAHVDCFLAPSRFAIEAHRSRGFRAPIRYLPHFAAPPAEDGEAVPVPHERPYFVYAGRLEKLKGVHRLVAAFRSFDQADLLVAGAGSQLEPLRRAAADLPHVRFQGPLDEPRLQTLIRGACGLVIPSLCYETFGLVAVEAFAAGTPVIARRIGALEELLGEGGSIGYRTEDELVGALRELATSPEGRRDLGEAARRSYLESYTEESHLERYFGLIDEVESGRSEGRS